MKNLLNDIDRVIERDGLNWEREGASVLVRFKTGRRQRVRAYEDRESVVFESVVLGSGNWPMSRRDVLYRAWRRNSHTEIVAFGLDRHERLVGRVRGPSASMHRNARTYLELLAVECDRFEYVLTGDDVGA